MGTGTGAPRSGTLQLPVYAQALPVPPLPRAQNSLPASGPPVPLRLCFVSHALGGDESLHLEPALYWWGEGPARVRPSVGLGPASQSDDVHQTHAMCWVGPKSKTHRVPASWELAVSWRQMWDPGICGMQS